MIYIENNSSDSFFNMALEEYLFYIRKDIHPVLLLWQNPPTIVIGRNQNTDYEINQNYVKQNNINVVRRLTGGGAVYHDSGNLNFTFINKTSGKSQFDFIPFIQNIINALAYFGVEAKYTGRNDITIDGKKFSGNAQATHKGSLMHHGTLMYDSDLSILSKALTPSKIKVASKGVNSSKSMVCNLKEFLPDYVDLNIFKEQIISEFSKYYGSIQRCDLSSKEIQAVKEISASKYCTWEWNYGKSPAYNINKEKRLDFGTVQIQIFIHDNIIKDFNIYGDFFTKQDIENLNKVFIGMEYNKRLIKDLIDKLDLSDYVDGLTHKQLLELII